MPSFREQIYTLMQERIKAERTEMENNEQDGNEIMEAFHQGKMEGYMEAKTLVSRALGDNGNIRPKDS